MANNRIIVEIVAEGKGFKLVQKEAEAVADQIDRTTKARDGAAASQHGYNKREKSIYQGNLASAKSFSKMQQSIGSGSSGLVAAYATLAANVFAATAAFTALRNAARFEQLTQSLEYMGAAAGKNLDTLTNKLQEATGYAISMEESMRAASLGTSAGFSGDQLQQLATVAKGASAALGRDLPDAYDRLIRGAAKLEPEILDELGIIVRIDDATNAYAQSIGKNVRELSQMERTQAFLNSILEQGAKKYGDIAEAVDSNPYEKLLATINNLIRSTTIILSDWLQLDDIALKLSDSIMLLAGAFTLVGSRIAKQMLPSVAEASSRLAELSKARKEAAASSLQNINTAGLSKGFVAALTSAKEGALTVELFNKGIVSANRSIASYERSLSNVIATSGLFSRATWEKYKAIQAVKSAKLELIRVQQLELQSMAQQNVAHAIDLLNQGRTVLSIKALITAIRTYRAEMLATVATAGLFAKALTSIKIAALATSSALRWVGAGLMKVLGPVGLALSLLPLLKEAWDYLFPATAAERAQERVREATDSIIADITSLSKTSAQFDFKLKGMSESDKLIDAATRLSGTYSTMADGILSAGEAASEATKSLVAELDAKLQELEKKRGAMPKERLDAFSSGKMDFELLDINREINRLTEEKNDLIKQGVAEQERAMQVVAVQAMQTLETFNNLAVNPTLQADLDNIRASFAKGPEAMEEALRKALPAVQSIDAAFKNLPNLLSLANKEWDRFLDKQDTPVTALKDSLQAVSNELRALEIKDNKDRTKAVEALIETNKTLFSSLGISSEEQLKKLLEDAKQLEVEYKRIGSLLGQNKAIQESLSKISKEFLAVQGATIDVKNIELELLKQQKEAQLAMTDRMNDPEKAAAIRLEILNLTMSIVSEEEKGLILLQEGLKVEDKRLKNLEAQLALSTKLKELAFIRSNLMTGRGPDILPEQEIALLVDEYNNKTTMLSKEAEIANKRLDIERQIAQIRLAIVQSELTSQITKAREVAKAAKGKGASKEQQKALNDNVHSLVQYNASITLLQYGLQANYEELQALEAARLSTAMQHAKVELDLSMLQSAGIDARAEKLASLQGLEQYSLDAKVMQLEIERQIAEEQKAGIEAAINASTSAEQRATLAETLAIAEERIADIGERKQLAVLETELQLRTAMLDLTKDQIDLINLRLTKEITLNNILKGRGGKLTPAEERRLIEAEYAAKVEGARLDIEVAQLTYELERRKFEIQLLSTNISEQERASLLDAYNQIASIEVDRLNLALERLRVEKDIADMTRAPIETIPYQTNTTLPTQFNQIFDAQVYGEVIGEAATQAAKNIESATANRREAEMKAAFASTPDEVKVYGQELDAAKVAEQVAKVSSAVGVANQAMQPFLTGLRSLGADGDFVATLAEGTSLIVESFNQIATSSNTAMASLQAVGAVVQTVGRLASISSDQRVASIDAEIAAEQRRDGKSKDSLARIAALEKKKEQEKKKAFETNKKMMMAQAVISTATAVMAAMAAPGLVPPANFALAALVGAMGAAQLAIISGTSYQGGGSSVGSVSAPGNLTVGERNNKVDVSQRPTGGELAYIQGARGTGTTANNFRPAFYGTNRATGGYVVGEQGPELFIPEMPGKVVPNDQAQNLGRPVNVSFNVSAIDANSFNDMLADQRGNIISLIREAANASGEVFLESVDTTAMAPQNSKYTARRI